MRILVTGADGFIGRALVARLLSDEMRGGKDDSGRAPARAASDAPSEAVGKPVIDGEIASALSKLASELRGTSASYLGASDTRELVLVDQRFAAPPRDPRITQVTGNIAERDVLATALEGGVDCVFHLASVPGGLAEKDFELGLCINLVATQTLLELLRLQGNAPRVVFASTIGVYGVPMPEVIDETLEPAPTLSYGAQKLIGEILITDYSRRGYIDGRSLRLPGIVARPPAASGMMSAFLSDIIRKLSAGEKFVCPVAAEGMSWWMSRTCVVENFIHAADLSPETAKAQRVWLLPVLHASLGDIVAAIARIHGEQVLRNVSYQDNPALRAQFANYPPMRCPRSLAAGFQNDGTVESLVQRALDEPPPIAGTRSST